MVQAQVPESVRTPVPQSDPASGTRSELRAKLNSTDPAAVAWGAWGAAQANVADLAPELTAALRRSLAEKDSPERPFVLRAVLDALIRLDARLSSEDLASTFRYDAVREAAIVLAARHPTQHAAQFEALRKKLFLEARIAIDNLLLAVDRPRAVAALLEDVRLRVEVTVADTLAPERRLGFVVCVRCGQAPIPEGFPPVVTYQLVREPLATDVVFADGAQPIAYRRTIHTARSLRTSERARPFDSCEHALGLLRWIAGDRAATTELVARSEVQHVTSGARGFLAEVGGVVREREAAWFELLERLAAAGLVSRDALDAPAPILVSIHDARADRSAALPPIPGARRTKTWLSRSR